MKSKLIIQRTPSRAIQQAKRQGIKIELPNSDLQYTEQEQTDID